MLPAEQRVRRPADFSMAVRRGRRLGASGLVVHHRRRAASGMPRAGFVVSREVGTAVTRNRLRRRLRHLLAPRLAALPPGTDLVVRVLPAAAGLTRRELADSLAGALDRLPEAAET